MANFGKLTTNEIAVDVIYSIDSQTQTAEITDFDENGFKLLCDLNLGDKVVLKQQDGGQLNLIVKRLTISKHVACQAFIEKT